MILAISQSSFTQFFVNNSILLNKLYISHSEIIFIRKSLSKTSGLNFQEFSKIKLKFLVFDHFDIFKTCFYYNIWLKTVQRIGKIKKLYNSEMNKNIRKISPEVLELFNEYDWPGNVREFKNIIESAFNFSSSSLYEEDSLKTATENFESLCCFHIRIIN